MSIKLVKKQQMKQRGVRFCDKEWERLKEVSNELDIPPSQIIRQLTVDFLDKFESVNPS